MNIPLKLRYVETPVRSTVAWFIPSNDPEHWLRELTRRDASLAKARLLPLADDSAATYFGVLAVIPNIASLENIPGAMPFGVIADRLFLPIHSRLDPEVSDREVAELLPDENHLYVWHPWAKPARFSADDCLSIVDLLRAPARRAASWSSASPGVVLNPRLTSIVWNNPPDFSSLWEESRDDIGTESPDLDKLPRSPAEGSGNPLAQLGRSLAGGFASLAQALAKLAPATAAQPTWVNKLAEWAAEKKSQLAAVHQAARNREIARLLHLLGTNPDEGLRFALPLGGMGQRGVAPPSNRLGQHDVNFNLKRLGGGGPADSWDIDYEYRQRLTASYRDLANREIRLGRYRRAAYIFGELLGDFVSAAKTLDDGGHYREAAVLYEERLHQPRAAAECLERGGLWAEAIEIFTRLKDYECIGKIYRQLQQEPEAQAAYRQAVDARLAGRDFLGAANLLERELNATDEAIDQLKAGWHDGQQSSRCFTEMFRIFAQHARHEDAASYVRELRRELHRARIVEFAEGLAQLSASYPDIPLQLLASDQTRTLAAERLPELDQYASSALLNAVGRLVPADRLLRHDIRRFLEQRFAQRPSKVIPKSRHDRIRFVRRFDLPPDVWKTAIGIDDSFVVAGWHGHELTVVRCAWDGSIDRPVHGVWRVAGGATHPAIMLAADPQGLHSILVHAFGERPVVGRRYFVPREKFLEGTAIGTHPGLTIESVAFSYDGRGTTYIADTSSNEFTVNAYAAMSDSLLNSWTIDLNAEVQAPEVTQLIWPLPFFVREGATYMGLGRKVSKWTPAGKVSEFVCPSTVRSLCGSVAHARPRVVAALDRGGMIVWDTAGDYDQKLFAEELSEPVIKLTRAGWLIAVAQNQVQVYSTRDRKLVLHGQCEAAAENPIAIVTMGQANRFGVCTEEGAVLLFEIDE